MCLVLLSIDTTPDLPLILVANRDEFYARPTQPLGFWESNPRILAGRDLQAGGTWMGIHTSGRFACLTNYRDMATIKSGSPSRGDIIPNLLTSRDTIPDFMTQLDKRADAYNGFNLLAGQGSEIYWYANQSGKIVRLSPGIHGLSNHLLDTPWPKVARGKTMLESCLDKDPMDDTALFRALTDRQQPADKNLPDTGIGIEWERLLSPLFIQSPTYGTRCTTILRIFGDNRIQVTERSWLPPDQPAAANPAGFQDRTISLSLTGHHGQIP